MSSRSKFKSLDITDDRSELDKAMDGDFTPHEESDHDESQTTNEPAPEKAPVIPVPTEDLKGFRYAPTQAASSILENISSQTGFSKSDIVNVALVLLQDASRVEITRVVALLVEAKTEAFMKALK